jgi:hypothetical protein
MTENNNDNVPPEVIKHFAEELGTTIKDNNKKKKRLSKENKTLGKVKELLEDSDE